jgi:predicted XRE-type DNA-binding protein
MAANKPKQITKGDIFDDLGLSPSEATALKIKASLLDSILNEVRRKGYTQAKLAALLDEYQPNVSNLLQGKITQMSIEKLLKYSDRLGLSASIRVKKAAPKKEVARV